MNEPGENDVLHEIPLAPGADGTPRVFKIWMCGAGMNFESEVRKIWHAWESAHRCDVDDVARAGMQEIGRLLGLLRARDLVDRAENPPDVNPDSVGPEKHTLTIERNDVVISALAVWHFRCACGASEVIDCSDETDSEEVYEKLFTREKTWGAAMVATIHDVQGGGYWAETVCPDCAAKIEAILFPLRSEQEGKA